MPKGRKPIRVPYSRIREMWERSQRDMTGLTKAALARQLGLSIRTVRGVINETGAYATREQKAKDANHQREKEQRRQQNGFMFFQYPIR